MGFLDRLFGRPEQDPDTEPRYRRSGNTAARSEDDIAVERYRYLLRTAPPETIEEVHREAFSKLSPEQRALLFEQLSANAPAGDKPAADDAKSLASSATRSELRQPGTMERSMGGGGGMGFGGMVASSLLGTVAGYVIGSALVSSFLPDANSDEASADDDGDTGDGDGDGGNSDAGADGASADAGSDSAGGDFGGGGFGGDFGGGDFGGGDFGGGDF
ncbi:MAG: hypothetical protein JWQ43_2893 [Glaciihabitans sp.]|nr:hypothetical protein [Glaciihabitans sp.]